MLASFAANHTIYAKSKISPSVLIPYNKAHFPKTFAEYGQRGVAKIEKLRKIAAEKAARSSKCDKVVLSELSGRGSPSNIVIWVDCENSERFYFNERQLNNRKAKAISQRERAWDRGAAISLCGQYIKQKATFPSTVDIHYFLGSAVNTVTITGAVIVHLNFDAKNAFGLELPYTARCTFRPGEKTGTIHIVNR